MSTATAHTPAWNIHSFAYVSAAPNPVGVGQQVYIYMWVDIPLTGALVTNDIRRHGYTLTITQPDGTNTSKTFDVVQDTTGVQSYFFTPETVGNYTLTFNYARTSTHMERCQLPKRHLPSSSSSNKTNRATRYSSTRLIRRCPSN